jgi:TPR repeat protein
MARLVRCIEGHVYDVDLNASCPQCATIADAEPTAGASDSASTIAVAAPAAAAAVAAPSSPQSSHRVKMTAIGVVGIAIAGGAWWTMSSHKPAPSPPQRQTDIAQPTPAKPVVPPSPAIPPPVVNTPPKPLAAPSSRQANLSPSSMPARPAIPAAPDNVRELQNAVDTSLAVLGREGQIEPSILAMARYAYGVGLINHNLVELGLPLIKQAAAGGVARAAGALGHGYLTGAYGLPKDAAQARVWLRQAAQAGEPGADYDLGSIEFAEKTTASMNAARDHFLSSYLASHPEALELLRRAKSGDAQAIALFRDLKINYSRMPPVLSVFYATYGRKDPVRTRAQLQAFSGTVAAASFFLARMMWNGEGGPQNRRGAVPLFLRSAEAGYTAALAYVGAALLDGTAGVRSPYNAAAASVITQLYDTATTTPGVNAEAVYNKALQELAPQQAAAIRQFRETATRIALPGPPASTHQPPSNAVNLAHNTTRSPTSGAQQVQAFGKFSAEAWRQAPLASPDWSREAMVRQFFDEFKAPNQQAYEMAPAGLDRTRVLSLLGRPGHSDEEYDLHGALWSINDEYRLSARNDHLYQITYDANRKVTGGLIESDGCNLDLSSFSDAPTIPTAAIGKFTAGNPGAKATLLDSQKMTIAQFETSIGTPGKHLSSTSVVGGMAWVGYEVWWRFDDGSYRYLTVGGHVARSDWKEDKFDEEAINGYSVVTLLPDCLAK